MRFVWLLILVVPFFIPAHFYPIPTYPEELFAAILVIALGVTAVISNKKQVQFNALFLWWLALGAIWALSWLFNQKEVISGVLFYQLFWVVGGFSLVGAAALNQAMGRNYLIHFSARVLVFSGFLYAATGLFAYFGGLKFLIPWIDADQSRLVGIMAHPNLTAVYLSMSLAAFSYFVYASKHALFEFKSLFFLFVVCLAAVLTGSRAFFVILMGQLVLGGLWILRASGDSSQGNKSRFLPIKYPAIVIAISGLLFFAFPPVDELISKKLTEEGFLNRQSSSEMLAERFYRSDQPRLGEWRKILEGSEIIENRWVGVGPGAYSEFSVAADEVIESPFRNGKTWRNAHNIFLMAFVEWGVIGLAFIAVFAGFLIVCFFKAERTGENYFIWLALGAILVHNLVEFSLWHLQFLVVFLILLSTQTKNESFRLTTPALRWVVVIPTVFLALWISVNSSRDYLKMVVLFSKPEVGEQDVRTLDLVAQNSLWRPYARMVMYYRLNPYATGVENQLREASLIADWSPLNLILMRQASLTAALGEEQKACERISRATTLYPAIAPTLEEELVYLSSQGAPFDLEKMKSCFSVSAESVM